MDSVHKKIIHEIKSLLEQARQTLVKNVNSTIVSTYFKIGKILVDEHQRGSKRAPYGVALAKRLSKELTKEFGRGFSVDNLENMRRFYIVYAKSETLSRKSGDTKLNLNL